MTLLERGYRCLKFFPAEPAGGVAYLKALAAPLPEARFCPTGGIDAASARALSALCRTCCASAAPGSRPAMPWLPATGRESPRSPAPPRRCGDAAELGNAMSALTRSRRLAGARAPCRGHGRRAPARAVRRRSRALRAVLAAPRATCCSTTPSTASPPRPCGLLLDLARAGRRRGLARRDVRGRARSTPPRTARCCTSRCATAPTGRSWSTARTSCRTSTRVLAQMRRLHRAGPRRRLARPHRRRRITDVVNIGIGGSDLGPADGQRGAQALRSARTCAPHFVSNVDGAHLRRDARAASTRRAPCSSSRPRPSPPRRR